MRICGIELSGSDAVICMIEYGAKQFSILDCRIRKLTLPKNHTREDLRYFQASFIQLMADYKIDKVAIKERMPKGKFAGGAVSFKLEATIQLIENVEVELLSTAEMKPILSKNPIPIPFASTELKVFQETAFTVAYAAQMRELYPAED